MIRKWEKMIVKFSFSPHCSILSFGTSRPRHTDNDLQGCWSLTLWSWIFETLASILGIRNWRQRYRVGREAGERSGSYVRNPGDDTWKNRSHSLKVAPTTWVKRKACSYVWRWEISWSGDTWLLLSDVYQIFGDIKYKIFFYFPLVRETSLAMKNIGCFLPVKKSPGSLHASTKCKELCSPQRNKFIQQMQVAGWMGHFHASASRM